MKHVLFLTALILLSIAPAQPGCRMGRSRRAALQRRGCIGVGIDAIVEGRVIYARSSSTATTLNLTPIVRRRNTGVLLSVRLTKN